MADYQGGIKPRVSVLIPTYNRRQYLAEAIESVKAQTFTDYEIIVVDDGSEDDTAILMQAFPEVQYYYQTHLGVSAARNTAIKKAQGEFIAFLDSDDQYATEKLEKQVAYLDEHSDCDIVFCSYRNYSHIPESELSERQNTILKAAPIRDSVATACIRRTLIDEVGEFNESYFFGEDTEWCLRLKMMGRDTSVYLPQQLYLRRIHENNISCFHKTSCKTEILHMAATVARSIRNKEKDD